MKTSKSVTLTRAQQAALTQAVKTITVLTTPPPAPVPAPRPDVPVQVIELIRANARPWSPKANPDASVAWVTKKDIAETHAVLKAYCRAVLQVVDRRQANLIWDIFEMDIAKLGIAPAPGRRQAA